MQAGPLTTFVNLVTEPDVLQTMCNFMLNIISKYRTVCHKCPRGMKFSGGGAFIRGKIFSTNTQEM